MTRPRVSIKPAAPDELPTVLQVLDESAAWLRAQGIDQWPDSFSGDKSWRMERIRSYVDHGMTYLVRDTSGDPIATFTFSDSADPQFAHGWPDGPENASYIFRMAVRRSAAGRDIGGQILDWAASEVARRGKAWLRVDVHRFNEKLQRYYLRHGFTKVAEVTAPDLTVPGRIRGSGALMQRPALDDKGEQVKAFDRYDTDGSAAIWQEASNLVNDMKLDHPPASPTAWNDALEQASRRLEVVAIQIRQRNGMYHRPLTGQPMAGDDPQDG